MRNFAARLHPADRTIIGVASFLAGMLFSAATAITRLPFVAVVAGICFAFSFLVSPLFSHGKDHGISREKESSAGKDKAAGRSDAGAD